MGYSKQSGLRPMERASKASHQHIVRDSKVAELLQGCVVPEVVREAISPDRLCACTSDLDTAGIELIVAIDGGYSEVPVRETFPSATVAFFQFGALAFKTADLATLQRMPFPGPEDMAKLKRLERIPLAIPVKNVRLRSQTSFMDSVRSSLQSFLVNTRIDDVSLAETLKWLLFEEFDLNSQASSWRIPQSPTTGEPITISRADLSSELTVICPTTGKPIYLLDALRLHERIDEEQGAAGILGYLTNTLEMLILAQVIRSILRIQPALLRHTLLIKDGPLGFFGQTAQLHRPMRRLVQFLNARHGINLVGIEKSGAFVDHAWEARETIPPRHALILGNHYIYRNIIPGQSQGGDPYGSSSLFGAKAIYRTEGGSVHVISVPILEPTHEPSASDLIGLQTAMAAMEKLRYHMHDNAIVPVALANQLVSLSVRPSQSILQTFAKTSISKASG